MDNSVRTIGAGEFKQKCLALIDQVATTGAPIVISKYGKPAHQLNAPLVTKDRLLRDLPWLATTW